MERFEQLAGEVRALGRRESTRSPSAPTRGVAPALGLSVSVADQLLQKTVFDGHDDLAAAVMLASPSLEPDHVADALMENPSARQLVADRGRLVPVFANAGVGPAVYQAVVARHAFLRDREEGDGPDGAADAQDAEAP
jgi:hypothetical protein